MKFVHFVRLPIKFRNCINFTLSIKYYDIEDYWTTNNDNHILIKYLLKNVDQRRVYMCECIPQMDPVNIDNFKEQQVVMMWLCLLLSVIARD